MDKEIIETRTARIWYGEDGIIRYEVLPDAEVTLEDTIEYITIQSNLTKAKKVLNLTDIRNVKSITRKGRQYLIGEETVKLTKACALIIESPVSRIIGNFMLGLNKPDYPVKLFTIEDEAIIWLKGFVK